MLWDLYSRDLMVIFSFVCTAAFVCGWLADRIMGYSGFGVIGNWLLLLIGAYAGLAGYNLAGYRLNWDPVMTCGAAAAGATFILIALAVIKSITNT
ncbi:MAG: hypothetical protein WBO55_14810 [Rhizobiaceae bacterium]